MPGANRLAVFGFPVFLVAPGATRLLALGFARYEGETAVTWPIWAIPLSLASISALMARREMMAERPPRDTLGAFGVVEAFASRIPQRWKRKWPMRWLIPARCWSTLVNRMELAMPPKVTAEMAKGLHARHAEGRSSMDGATRLSSLPIQSAEVTRAAGATHGRLGFAAWHGRVAGSCGYS